VTNLPARNLGSKYHLLGLVGQGQFGRVYCAVQRETGKLVALKELAHDRCSTHKFSRELQFLLSLQHPNIVACHAVEQTSTGRYLVLDYCEAGTLRNLLEEDVELHPLQGLTLVAQILAALAHAHERQIIHCDIKPENILLTAHAQGWTAHISDFGIARLSQESPTEEGSNMGSPAYMAPERFQGQCAIASDLYAVGIVMFEILVGTRPFSGTPANLMTAHLHQPVQIPDFIPPELGEIILKALQKLPHERFRSASEMLAALAGAIAHAEPQLNQSWKPSTLLRFRHPAPLVQFHYQFREHTEAPVQQLVSSSPAHQSERFFEVSDRRIRYQVYPEKVAVPRASASISQVELPDPITNLVVQAHGCLAATQTALYWLPKSSFQPAVSAATRSTIQQLCEVEPETMVTIAPTGRWIATTHLSSEEPVSQTHIWNLRSPHPLQPFITLHTGLCLQVIAFDAHHLALLSREAALDSTDVTEVQIELFTRRGTKAGRLKLPLLLSRLFATLTSHRLLAIESNYPTSLLMLDLKPFRLRRIDLGLVPTLVAAAAWGYAVTSQDGQIMLLNQYGQLIGAIAAPATPTALCFLAPHQLLIATWEEAQGYLYGVDLRELDLDLLF